MFVFDARKQQGIVNFMKNYLSPSNPGLVIIEDRTVNALDRSYRFYEINGMLSRAIGSQSFFGVTTSEYPNYNKGAFDKYYTSHYNASSYKRSPNSTTQVLLVDSSFPLKSLMPLDVRACLIPISSGAIEIDAASLSCPAGSWVQLSSLDSPKNLRNSNRSKAG